MTYAPQISRKISSVLNATQVPVPTPAGQAARTTTYAYDSMNRLTTVTDPLGHATVSAYDAASNPVTATDGLGNVTTQAYDVLNQPTVLTDPLAHAATTTFDAEGQATRERIRERIRGSG